MTPTLPNVRIDPIDLNFQGRPQAIAAYLIRGPGAPVLVETGPGSTLPALLQGLAKYDLAPGDIRDVLVTHIHLDHAGAAGWWARLGARIHVHHIGAPHLIEPDRLLASARRVYGDQMDALWGEFLSAPESQVHAVGDGDTIEAGGLEFKAHDTPGHARHHHVFTLGDIAFVGDLAGVRRPGGAHVRLPTPPPEFDREAWLASIDRIRALNLSRIYLTHYGAVDEVNAHWDVVARLLEDYTERARSGLASGLDRDAIVADFGAWELARLDADHVDPEAWPVYTSLGPVGMSVDGLLRYWQKRGMAPP